MLVLSRKQDETIVIGENVTITILKVKGNTVRLGIDAPRQVRVVRGELPPLEQPAEANVTVVFSDLNNEDSEGPNLEIVPFPVKESETPSSPQLTAEPTKMVKEINRVSGHCDGGNSTSRTPSISFKQALPESLQHNRLQQIVNELTSK